MQKIFRLGFEDFFYVTDSTLQFAMMMMLTKVVNESSFMTASEEEDHYRDTRNLTRWNIPKFNVI